MKAGAVTQITKTGNPNKLIIKLANSIRLIIDKLTHKPNKLFLIDGLGAFLTAFFLGVILVRLETAFGMPRRTLYFLSAVAGIYTVYSFGCYFFVLSNWRPFLKAITIANMIYCFLTIVLVIYFYQGLTIWGLIYFSLEITVMCILIFTERMALSESVNRSVLK